MITLNMMQEKRMQQRIFFFSIAIMIMMFTLLVIPQEIFAESSDITIMKKLRTYEIDSISSLVSNSMRTIGFALIKFLAWMGDSLYGGLQQVFDAITFSYSDEIVALVNRYSVLYKAFFLVAVTGFGLYLIMRKGQRELNTVMCIFAMILILSAMPLMMQKIGNLTVASSHFVTNQWNNDSNEKKITSISGTVLKESIVDLRKVDKNMTDTALPKGLKKGQGYNNFNSNTWKSIDINTYMDYESDNYTLEHKSVWENKLVPSGESGEYETEKIDGWTKFMSNYYYRYQVTSWFGIFTMLGCMSFLLFFLIIRAAKIVIDLAAAMIYTPFIAVTDLTTGQRIKETIKDIIAHFAAMFLLAALMGLYFVAFTWINASKLSLVPQLGMHIALVWAILDGPNVIERIIGVDVGYSGVWKTVMGVKAGADIAKGAGRFAAKTGKGAAGAAAKTGKGIGSAIFGKKPVDDALNKVKKAPGKELQTATDGKGLRGFSKNVRDAAAHKMAGDHSTADLQNSARMRGDEPAKDPRSEKGSSASGNLRAKNSAAAAGMNERSGSSRPGGSNRTVSVAHRPQSVPLRQGQAPVRPRPGRSGATERNRRR